MQIRLDDLSETAIATFLESHLEDMRLASPPESKHALDLDGLRKPDIRFYTGWEGELLVACGALKLLDANHGEIKSMRTDPLQRGRGLASVLLTYLIEESKRLGLTRLSLETGAMPFFIPAHALYRKFGFIDCEPFSNYKLDPNSVFFTREI